KHPTVISETSLPTLLPISDSKRLGCAVCWDCKGTNLSGAARARDRAIFTWRPDRYVCSDCRGKSLTQSRSAVLHREPTRRWWKSRHEGRGARGLRRLHHHGCQHELHRQSQPIPENSLRPVQGF